MAQAESHRFHLLHWLQNFVLRGVIGGLLWLPYRWRVPMCGWFFARIVAPLAGYDRRIRENLRLIFPDMAEAEIRRMQRAVPDNIGRSVIEMYSGAEFFARAEAAPLHGAGLGAMAEARAQGRPVVMVTGHFGNYLASRVALRARGFQIGGLYRAMSNRYFNAHYVAAMAQSGEPLFERGRHGMAAMLRHLRGGGMIGIVQDQHMKHAPVLQFFGQPARTALSAAELALKYDALLIPSYATRQANGLDFDIVVDAPIARGTAAEMAQALNDHLEAHVRLHPEQWFWIHRRWK